MQVVQVRQEDDVVLSIVSLCRRLVLRVVRRCHDALGPHMIHMMKDFWRNRGTSINSKPSAGDGMSSESLTSADVSERLMDLSRRASAQLERLPNQGRPVVGKDGLIREYRGIDASDLPDPGHRHWSGLWALYPGFQVWRRDRGKKKAKESFP